MEFNLPTPALLLDLEKLEKNLSAMQHLANRNSVRLRPHAKTHKSVEIANRQIALGACGLTVATVEEAAVFSQAGIRSITVSRPIVTEQKLDRLLGMAKECSTDLSVVVDSEEGIKALAGRATEAGITPDVFIKIDVGLHRCGVDPESSRPLELAKLIQSSRALNWRGVLSHAGQVYAAKSVSEVTRIAEQERLSLVSLRKRMKSQGVDIQMISVGATPTVLTTENFDGIDEIRPGNYVFLDLLPFRLGVATQAQVALTVLTTVISKNSDFFITDAGSKTLTSDQGGHGFGGAKGYGIAFPADRFLEPDSALTVEALSEEHGKVRRGKFDLKLGSQLRIIPNHACPVANLAKSYAVIGRDGQLSTWPVDAARCSQ